VTRKQGKKINQKKRTGRKQRRDLGNHQPEGLDKRRTKLSSNAENHKGRRRTTGPTRKQKNRLSNCKIKGG